MQWRAGYGARSAVAAAALLCALPSVVGAATARASATLRLGARTLTRCSTAPLAYCGRLRVPLDRADPAGARIAIAYRFYPANGAARPPSRTVVPVEGGPGYSTIGSVDGGYRPMYGALLRRWNLLAVDLRGTGASTALDCAPLQGFSGATDSAAFRRAVAACAARLNHRWRTRGGRWAHASSLFETVAAAEDLASVVRSLRLGRVDLYGDSYGSYFAQIFAGRHPGLVRSVVLDSSYPIRGLDPRYASTVAAMRAAFDAVCRRAPACASAARGS